MRPWSNKPTSLTSAFHYLPHHNLFNLKSQRYKDGLKVLAFQPIFFGILALIPLMMYMSVKLSMRKKNRTYSGTKKLQYLVVTVCTGALMVLLLLELCLHTAVLKYLPSVVIDIESYSYIELEIERYFNKLEFLYDLEPNATSKDKWQKLDPTEKVADLRETYEALVEKIVSAANRITKEKAIMLPRHVQTPLKQECLLMEWLRFLLSVVVWSCGVGFCFSIIYGIYKPYMVCGVCGYVFCCAASGALLAEAAALADLCFEPIDGLANLQPRAYEKYMNDIQMALCSSWTAEIQRRVRTVLRLMARAADAALWNEINDRRQSESENANIDATWPEDSSYKIRTEFSYEWYLYFTRGELSDLNELVQDEVDCQALDEFADDAYPMCQDDRVLAWLVLQLLPLLVVFLGCYILLVLGISRMRHITHYTKRWNLKFDVKMPETITRSWKRFLIEASTSLICDKCCDELHQRPSETMDAGTSTNMESTEDPPQAGTQYRSTDDYPDESNTDTSSSYVKPTRRGKKRSLCDDYCPAEVRFRDPPVQGESCRPVEQDSCAPVERDSCQPPPSPC